MRCILFCAFVVFGCLTGKGCGKPQRMQANHDINVEEIEYELDGMGPNESSNEDRGSHFNEKEQAVEGQGSELEAQNECREPSQESNNERPDRARKDIVRMREDNPRAREDAVRVREDNPRAREDVARMREDLPRTRKDIDRAREDIPRAKDVVRVRGDIPKAREDIARTREDVPRVREDIPRVSEDNSRVREDNSRLREDTPAVREDIPRSPENIVRVREDIPRTREDISRAQDDNTRAREDIARTRDDSYAAYKTNRNEGLQEERVDLQDERGDYSVALENNPEIKSNNEQIDFERSEPHHVQKLTNGRNRFLRNFGNMIGKSTDKERLSADEGDSLFENKNDNEPNTKSDKNEYNHDTADSEEQTHYFKQFYNKIKSGNTLAEDKDYTNQQSDREKRESGNSLKIDNTVNLSSTSSDNEELESSTTEDEEALIKSHVKMLTQPELQELLESLSEEKRELLKKIMTADADSSDKINKREVTKKDGVVENTESVFFESGKSNPTKLQDGGENSNTESSPISYPTDTSKLLLTSNNDMSVTKTLETMSQSSNSSGDISKPSSSVNVDFLLQPDSNINPVTPTAESKNLETLKTENKREIVTDTKNADMLLNDAKTLTNGCSEDLVNDQGYFCAQDEYLSQIIDDDSQSINSNGNVHKREAITSNQAGYSDSMNSLEESFPNSNTYYESDRYVNANMVPLVRVKRTDADVQNTKRSVALSDSKVGYCPYKTENGDEDNEEGSEFNENGFYERTSNLGNLEEPSNNFAISSRYKKSRTRNLQPVINRPKVTQSNNMENDMSLGSDSDAVLTGVESVDENLMYNSGSRYRRTTEGFAANESPVSISAKMRRNRLMRATPLADEMRTVADSFNAPRYEEGDAFGPLPRSYEGELSRYKRIRRVKQPTAQEFSQTNKNY